MSAKEELKRAALLFLVRTGVMGILSKTDWVITKEADEAIEYLFKNAIICGATQPELEDLFLTIQDEANDRGITIQLSKEVVEQLPKHKN